MAVYKSTNNYPFMNNIDIRTALADASSIYPVQYLTCKVDTSNKNVTGYSIRILDEDNNQIFPYSNDDFKISPIKELQISELGYQENGLNSGINGTFLKIPFFQNYNNKMVDSYNAIYYRPKYSVEYIITDLSLPENYPDNSEKFCNPSHWELLDNGNYAFNWNGINNSTDAQKLKEQNNIYLDGELILEGQTILVANNGVDGVPGGFYRVLKRKGEYTQTELEPMSTQEWLTYSSTPYQAVITKGETLNNKIINKDEFNTFSFITDQYLWTDIEGSNILQIHTGMVGYKWEITLYQGNGVIIPDIENPPLEIFYDNLDNRYYDMVVSSGTILGSNSGRIQIADMAPFGVFSVKPQLPALKNGTLVLQSKYMSFSSSTNPNDSTASFSNERYYVQTYDSTYGHVYPIEGSLPASTVESAGTVRFYKYSLNPEDILTTDTVEYGIGKEVSFVLCKVTKNDDEEYIGKVATSEADFLSVGVNNRLYGIERSVLETLVPQINSVIESDQKIIITNNTKPYMNGIYTVYERNDIKFPYEREGFKVLFLKRSASFNTWGSFIGRIVYVPTYYKEDGSIVSMNIESLAGSNPDYSLWNPDEVESGDSNLYFSEERPILLFENKIKYSVDLITDRDQVYSGVTIGDIVDGIPVKSGMKVLYCVNTTLEFYQLCEVTDTGYTDLFDGIVGDCYCYVAQGEKSGKTVVKFSLLGSYIGEDLSLYTAVVLKNTSNYTFVSPSLDTKPGMKLKLKGNNYVTLNGENSLTQWLGIKDYDNKIYCIKHEELLTPTKLVSETSEENNTPWKYEIKSFFKASDFNPFYCYESPYLILYKNGREYSSLSNIVGEQGVIAGVVSNDDSSLVINYFADSNVSFSNVIKLSAKYIQSQGVSWESYRWVLLDVDGNILQDTGKKYDKDMSVLFYGLSCDSKINYSVYYATLYVEDDLKNLCVYTIRLIVKPGESKDSGIPFTAEYECGSDAVKLSYGGNSQMMPSYRNLDGTIDSLYIENSPYFDKGVTYTNGEGFSITNKNNSQERGFDYSKGSNISKNDGSSAIYFSQISQGNKIGVSYYTSFNSTEPTQEVNKNNSFELPGQTDLNEDPGQLYFETEFSLNDNQCGRVLDFMVEGTLEENDNVAEPCYYDDGSVNDLRGYLTFELFTNNILTSNGSIDSRRDCFNLRIKAYPLNESVESKEYFLQLPNNFITVFEKTNNYRYYIQKSNIIPDEENEYYECNIGAQLYVKKDKNNNFFTSGANDFGNLCLFSPEESSNEKIFYWVEDRPFLRSIADSYEDVLRYFDDYMSTGVYSTGQFIYNSRNTHTDENKKVLKWPGIVPSVEWDERNLYWNEGQLDTPVFWEDVTASTAGVQEVKACPRHPGNSNNLFHVIIKINNVNELYEKIITNPSDIMHMINYYDPNKIDIFYMKGLERIDLCEFKIVKTIINE